MEDKDLDMDMDGLDDLEEMTEVTSIQLEDAPPIEEIISKPTKQEKKEVEPEKEVVIKAPVSTKVNVRIQRVDISDILPEAKDDEKKENKEVYLKLQNLISEVKFDNIVEKSRETSEKIKTYEGISNIIESFIQQKIAFGTDQARKFVKESLDEKILNYTKDAFIKHSGDLNKAATELSTINSIVKVAQNLKEIEEFIIENTLD